MKILKTAIVATLSVGVLSCQSGQTVKVSEVPKKVVKAVEQNHGHTPQAKQSKFSWKTPKGWSEIPNTSSMRLASFKVLSKSGDEKLDAQTSIVLLGGMAGGVAANINRWRNQVGLDPLAEDVVNKQVQVLPEGPKLGELKWIMIGNSKQPNNAILAGMFKQPSQMMFIKMTGPIKTLDENKSQFIEFCQSIDRQ